MELIKHLIVKFINDYSSGVVDEGLSFSVGRESLECSLSRFLRVDQAAHLVELIIVLPSQFFIWMYECYLRCMISS